MNLQINYLASSPHKTIAIGLGRIRLAIDDVLDLLVKVNDHFKGLEHREQVR